MLRRSGSVALSIALVLLCAARAPAQGTAPSEPGAATREAASEHFRLGVELFREGSFVAALGELQRAYALVPDYRVHYNIAQAELALSDYVAASQSFRRYLDEGGVLVEPRRRREIEAQLLELSRRTGSLRIEVSAGAEVFVDGAHVGTAPLPAELPVSVGKHRVWAQAEHGASVMYTVDVAGGERKDMRLLMLEPRSEASAAPAPATPGPKMPARLGRRTRWGIGLLGAGVGLGLAAGATWFASREARDDAERGRGDARSKQRRADALLVSSEVAGATGAALTATSIVLFLTVLTELTSSHEGDTTPTESARAARTELGVGLGQVTLSRRF